MNILIAIDPGASGGIAVLHGDQLEVFKNPDTPQDLCVLLSRFRAMALTAPTAAAFSTTEQATMVPMKAYIERVTGFIGGEGHPASRMFEFGKNAGMIEGILIGLQIPYELVSPVTWQRGLGVISMSREKLNLTPGMTPEQIQLEKRIISTRNTRIKTAHKNQLKKLAQQLFPSLMKRVTLATADALLILEWGRRRENAQAPRSPQATLAL